MLVAESKFVGNVAKGNASQFDGGALSYWAEGSHCGGLTVYDSEFEKNAIQGASSGAAITRPFEVLALTHVINGKTAGCRPCILDLEILVQSSRLG